MDSLKFPGLGSNSFKAATRAARVSNVMRVTKYDTLKDAVINHGEICVNA
jgi:hypothetical protein